MPELVIFLPDDLVRELHERYGDSAFLWDYVENEGNDIVVLFCDVGAFPHGVEEYYFPDSEHAAEEAMRLNREMGLSDEEIAQRTEMIMEREQAWTQRSNLQWPDDPADMMEEARRRIDSGERDKGH